MRATSEPYISMTPLVGRKESMMSLSNVDLPAPEGPVRNWNEQGAIAKVRSRRISGPTP